MKRFFSIVLPVVFCITASSHTQTDLRTYIQSQDTLWVLNGKVLKEPKDLTIDLINCAEPYKPLGKALGIDPADFTSLSVITGEKAEQRYGAKRTAQVVEITTKGNTSRQTTPEKATPAKQKKDRFDDLASTPKLNVSYEEIEDFVKNHTADYQDLLNRFLQKPGSLTVEECVKLYYGFAFTKSFDVQHLSFVTEPFTLFNQGKTQDAYDACMKELQKAPVSLSLLYLMARIAFELGKKEDSKYYSIRFLQLYSAVLASGNGFSKETALKVICIPDEYAIFRDMMGMKCIKQDFVDKRYDRMTLDRGNKGESVILWFDTYLAQRNLSPVFEGIRKGTTSSR